RQHRRASRAPRGPRAQGRGASSRRAVTGQDLPDPGQAEPSLSARTGTQTRPDAKPRVWPILLLTLLCPPLSPWALAVFNALYAVGDTLLRIARGQAKFSDFTILATEALNRIFDHGVLQIVIGVAGNATVFAFVALAAAFTRPRETHAAYPGGFARLRM